MYIHMVIFYTSSYYGKAKYQKWYDLVRKTIKEFHIELLSPEEGNYRIVYRKTTQQLFIILIRHRKDVYRMIKEILK